MLRLGRIARADDDDAQAACPADNAPQSTSGELLSRFPMCGSSIKSKEVAR